jgi:hypothetical protein
MNGECTMDGIKLVPDLSSCIETTARNAHRERLFLLLSGNQENDRLKTELTILEKFLETADFKKLRAKSEKYLVEGKRVEFIIYLQDGKARYDLKIL